jgi:hypothetical protein
VSTSPAMDARGPLPPAVKVRCERDEHICTCPAAVPRDAPEHVPRVS